MERCWNDAGKMLERCWNNVVTACAPPMSPLSWPPRTPLVGSVLRQHPASKQRWQSQASRQRPVSEQRRQRPTSQHRWQNPAARQCPASKQSWQWNVPEQCSNCSNSACGGACGYGIFAMHCALCTARLQHQQQQQQQQHQQWLWQQIPQSQRHGPAHGF